MDFKEYKIVFQRVPCGGRWVKKTCAAMTCKTYLPRLETDSKNSRVIGMGNTASASTTNGEFASSGLRIKPETWKLLIIMRKGKNHGQITLPNSSW